MTARAVALEPRNAAVHVAWAFIGYRKAMSGAWPASEALAAAAASAPAAAELDPGLPGGQVMLASIYGMRGRTEPALDAASQVERLNPNAWGAPHGR